MSQTLLNPPPRQEQTQADRNRGARIVTVLAMIVALIGSALTRDWAREDRVIATRSSSPLGSGQTTLSSMNSFTLALVLGGLRGPLVMMLWTSSESQKTNKDLEDFDTKLELIRLLQPEFDSAQLFQIWNKAYNISVQMSSLINKYTTILDAIDYGEDLLRNNPDNINVLEAVGEVYFNKLGQSAEKVFYSDHVRKETLPHRRFQRLNRDDPGWRRMEMDPMLDADGNILPELLRPTHPRPPGLATDQAFNDGSELQYLAPLAPFKYGISPLGLGYNYYMKAQTLLRTTHVKHAQLGDVAVDSRPAVAMKFWAEEEQEIGRRTECQAFNIPLPLTTDRADLEIPTAMVPLTQKVVDPAKLDEAIWHYDASARLAVAARAEYQRHLNVYGSQIFVYQSHLDGLITTQDFAIADAAYLHAMTSTGAERAKWVALAKEKYGKAMFRHELMVMKYYTDDSLIAQVLPGISKDQLDSLPPQVLEKATMQAQMAIDRGLNESHIYDRSDTMQYMRRIAMRLQILDAEK